MRDKIIKSLNSIKQQSLLKSKDVFIVEYEGVRLTFESGKTSWNTIGAAKNALRNAIPSLGDWRERLRLIKELENEGLIKYIKLK